jgi:hypothetical protein
MSSGDGSAAARQAGTIGMIAAAQYCTRRLFRLFLPGLAAAPSFGFSQVNHAADISGIGFQY